MSPAEIGGLVEEIKRDVDLLDGIVRGNGKDGLTTRIKLLEEKVESVYKIVWFVAFGICGLLISEVGKLLLSVP